VIASESIKWHSRLPVEEHRKERRHAASEAVAIILQPGLGDVSAAIRGRLVDRSNSGCRIRHSLGDLRVNEEVSLVWGEITMRARVVWNNTAGSATETGLQFLDV